MACIYSHIPDSVRRCAKTHKAVLLRGLSTHLGEAGHERCAAEVYDLFQSLRHVSLNTLIELASPALWLNVRRLYRTGHSVSYPDLFLSVRRLRAAAFDSYWRVLNGSAIEIDTSAEPAVFPSLGYRLRGQRFRFRSVSSLPAIERDGGLIGLQELREATPVSVHKLPGLPSLVVAEKDLGIFDEFSFGAMCGNDVELKMFADPLIRSLELIRTVMPDIGEQLCSSIRWFVPLSSPDPSIHRSHSSSDLPDVMFLSASNKTIDLAEAIVHEFGHNELNAVETVCPLVEGHDTADLYSPWRTDKRPLRGLLHALFVFCGVGAFLQALDDRGQAKEPAVLRKRILTMHRLRLGLRQIPNHRLTAGGKSVVALIQNATDEISASLRTNEPAPPQLATHWCAWRAEHPELVTQGMDD